ncbi:MAG TPA: YbjN domain-containing protein [Candidatus Limiplasma stercoravium]|nr:YbjN domain-containing protein [Candidatus Limiplasma stercoravium]
MFAATKRIYNALKAKEGLKVFTEENEKSSEVWLQFPVKNGGNYRIKFISTDNDNDVAVRVFGLLRVDDTQKAKILEALNALNVKYRYVKFCCDNDGDVNIEYDYPVRSENPENSAEEIVIRFVKIIDDAYPQLMHALWN